MVGGFAVGPSHDITIVILVAMEALLHIPDAVEQVALTVA
jgi:hypothetical protein